MRSLKYKLHTPQNGGSFFQFHISPLFFPSRLAPPTFLSFLLYSEHFYIFKNWIHSCLWFSSHALISPSHIPQYFSFIHHRINLPPPWYLFPPTCGAPSEGHIGWMKIMKRCHSSLLHPRLWKSQCPFLSLQLFLPWVSDRDFVERTRKQTPKIHLEWLGESHGRRCFKRCWGRQLCSVANKKN